jgi:hypothetical protein
MGKGKTINEIITEMVKEGSVYDDIINKILYPRLDLKHALQSEIAISLLEKPTKVIEVYNKGEFKYYYARIVMNQVKSTTSPFHNNVRKTMAYSFGTTEFDLSYLTNEDDVDDLNNKIDKERQLKLINELRSEINVSWFDAEIFRLYYDKDYTYRQIEDEFNIDHCLAWHTVAKIRKKLIKLIEKNN